MVDIKHTITGQGVTLVLGDVQTWAGDGRLQNMPEHCVFVEFSSLTPSKLNDLSPDLVLSALIGPGFDALDVALFLRNSDYQGKYLVIGHDLLNPDLIRAEIRNHAPQIDVDVMSIASDGDQPSLSA